MRKRFPQGFVFFLCYISYVAIYAARLNFFMASPGMISDGMLTEAQYGFIGSVFFVTYACGRLLNGMIGDCVAPWAMIMVGLLFTGISNLLIGIIPTYIIILIFWAINAYAQSMLWSSLLRCMTGLYGKVRANKKISILVSSVSVGNIAGIILSTWMVDSFGVRWAFLLPGMLTVLLGLSGACVLRTVPEEDNPVKQSFPVGEFIKNRQIRGILLPALFHGVVKDNIGNWMAIYFVTKYAINLKDSAWFVLLIPAVGMIGRLVYPMCYKLSKQRENLISVICFGICAALSAVLLTELSVPIVAACCLSLIYALISMINTSTLSMFPLRFADKNMVSSVSGVADFATYLGAGIGSAVYGFWNKGGDFSAMFISWVVLCVVSILLLLVQKPFRKSY